MLETASLRGHGFYSMITILRAAALEAHSCVGLEKRMAAVEKVILECHARNRRIWADTG